MKEIKLTQGKVALVDDEDYEYLNSIKWFVYKNGNGFYAARNIRVNGKLTTQRMHQLIMGDNPLKLMIDHKDGNGCNNQKGNMRFCTNKENQMNRKPNKNSSSPYKGVYYDKIRKKWEAYIRVDGKSIHLGRFIIKEDAARAYNAAAIKYFGDFALLNIIK